MSALRTLLASRAVAYYPELARAVGGVAPALFFQQVAHWQGKNADGWVFRTQEEFEEELAMSAKAQATARAHLVSLGVLEEKYDGMPRRLYYRPVWEKVESLLKTCQTSGQDLPVGQVQSSPNGEATLKSSNESIEESNTPLKPPQGGGRGKAKTIQAPSAAEYVAMYEAFETNDPLGPLLGRLVRLSAAENKTGRKRYSSAYTGFVEPLQTMRASGLTDAAIKSGIEAALNANAPSMNYVKKVAKKYEPDDAPELFQGNLSREERAARRQEGRPKRESDLPEDFDPDAVKAEWERRKKAGAIGLGETA